MGRRVRRPLGAADRPVARRSARAGTARRCPRRCGPPRSRGSARRPSPTGPRPVRGPPTPVAIEAAAMRMPRSRSRATPGGGSSPKPHHAGLHRGDQHPEDEGLHDGPRRPGRPTAPRPAPVRALTPSASANSSATSTTTRAAPAVDGQPRRGDTGRRPDERQLGVVQHRCTTEEGGHHEVSRRSPTRSSRRARVTPVPRSGPRAPAARPRAGRRRRSGLATRSCPVPAIRAMTSPVHCTVTKTAATPGPRRSRASLEQRRRRRCRAARSP